MVELPELTSTQQGAFTYISEYWREMVYAPTYAEIATHCRWNSSSTAQDVCSALARKGYLVVTPRGPMPKQLRDEFLGFEYDSV